MSDISLPPDATKPKKKLLDNSFIRCLLLLPVLFAPLPMLVALIDWTQESQESPFITIKELVDGSGAPPVWLVPAAFLPSLVALMIIGRSAGQRLGAFIALLVVTACEVALFMQLQGA